jgi:hypothetical protein
VTANLTPSATPDTLPHLHEPERREGVAEDNVGTASRRRCVRSCTRYVPKPGTRWSCEIPSWGFTRFATAAIGPWYSNKNRSGVTSNYVRLEYPRLVVGLYFATVAIGHRSPKINPDLVASHPAFFASCFVAQCHLLPCTAQRMHRQQASNLGALCALGGRTSSRSSSLLSGRLAGRIHPCADSVQQPAGSRGILILLWIRMSYSECGDG